MNMALLANILRKAAGYAKRGWKFAAPILASTALAKGGDYIAEELAVRGATSYSTAIKAIMSSNMPSSVKADAVKALKVNANVEYYKTVARIVRSSACSSVKIDMIKNIALDGEVEES